MFWQRIAILILMISSAVLAADPLDAPCPLDLRGTPFKQAMDELAAKTGIPYVLDDSVTDQDALKPIRLFAAHLNGSQAFKWLAYWAELDVAVVDGAVFVATADRLPASWRISDTHQEVNIPNANEKNWHNIRRREADIQWIDAPLSLIARDVSKHYGIDIIFHAEILKKQNLIHMQSPKMSLEGLCEALKGQLNAEIDYFEGALRALPPHTPVTSQPTRIVPDLTEKTFLGSQGLPTAHRVVIGREIADWQALGDVLTSAMSLNCRVIVPPGIGGLDWEAVGSATDILEGGKLLGRLNFQLKSDGDQKLPVLLIQVHPIGRYPP